MNKTFLYINIVILCLLNIRCEEITFVSPLLAKQKVSISIYNVDNAVIFERFIFDDTEKINLKPGKYVAFFKSLDSNDFGHKTFKVKNGNALKVNIETKKTNEYKIYLQNSNKRPLENVGVKFKINENSTFSFVNSKFSKHQFSSLSGVDGMVSFVIKSGLPEYITVDIDDPRFDKVDKKINFIDIISSKYFLTLKEKIQNGKIDIFLNDVKVTEENDLNIKHVSAEIKKIDEHFSMPKTFYLKKDSLNLFGLDDGVYQISNLKGRMGDEEFKYSKPSEMSFRIKNGVIVGDRSFNFEKSYNHSLHKLLILSDQDPVDDIVIEIDDNRHNKKYTTNDKGFVSIRSESNIIKYRIYSKRFFNKSGLLHLKDGKVNKILVDKSRTVSVFLPDKILSYEDLVLQSFSSDEFRVLETIYPKVDNLSEIKFPNNKNGFLKIWYNGFPDIYKISVDSDEIKVLYNVRKDLEVNVSGVPDHYEYELFVVDTNKKIIISNGKKDDDKSGVFTLKVPKSTYSLALLLYSPGKDFEKNSFITIYNAFDFEGLSKIDLKFESFMMKVSYNDFITTFRE
jgi:hypothetical protein